MPRPVIHHTEGILDAARALVLEHGAAAATIDRIAGASGAPVGSLYHRFGSRDALLARLWVRAVKRSQERYLHALEDPSAAPVEAAVAAALAVYDHALADRGDARLLVSLRREDLLERPLPPEIARELDELNRPLGRAMARLARVLYGRAGRAQVERVVLATVDLVHGALRRHLVAGTSPPPATRTQLERAVRAALGP